MEKMWKNSDLVVGVKFVQTHLVAARMKSFLFCIIFFFSVTSTMSAQQMVTCYPCQGKGICSICFGTGGRWFYGMYYGCVGCGGKGICGFCAGKGKTMMIPPATNGNVSGVTISSCTHDDNRRQKIQCMTCKGSGKCSSCAGRGEYRVDFMGETHLRDCVTCKGGGQCFVCHGRGYTR